MPRRSRNHENIIHICDKIHGSSVSISQISLSYGVNIPSYIFPPTRVSLYAGNSPNNLKRISDQLLNNISQEDDRLVKSNAVHFEMDLTAYRYYQIVANNLPRIPSWHNGKGEKGWLFVDEIFFYR